ncbi:GH3 auxin-responsive promoter family protein [Chloroflexota bacterium]
MARVFPHEMFEFMPSVDIAEKMSFEERIQSGFDTALSDGLDICLTMSSVAVAIANRFSQKSSNTSILQLIKKPKALPRLIKGLVKSKLAHRPLLPKDLWNLKGLITFGIDSDVFRDKIKEAWGTNPLEFHGCTEAVMIAMQTWDHQGMTFVPQLNFFEFIPEEESIKSRENPAYQPSTLLMNELKPGKYELVVTSFHGGPFIRYRLGHLVEITALRNEKLNIDIPQMVFLSRVDDQIDIAGFTRLSEKIIWQAIENTGLNYADWTARKECNGEPRLHLYLELKEEESNTAEEITVLVNEELKKLDAPYAELESFTGLRPLKTTLLPHKAFNLYQKKQRATGAELTQISPPHINPTDSIVDFLINAATDKTVVVAREKVKV